MQEQCRNVSVTVAGHWKTVWIAAIMKQDHKNWVKLSFIIKM